MDFQTLYDFIYSLTKLYDEAKDRNTLVEGFKQALSLFFPIEETKIYLMDEYSFLLKDFTKPWENLSQNSENEEIKKHFDNFLIQKSQFVKEKNILYFPIVQKHKTLGLIKLKSREEIKEKNEFFKVFPLVSAQISMFITTLKNSEQIKISTNFHQTLRNIAQITQTQYELDYILPIMGEMIDGFIQEHLIYIFIKNKNKKEYKLIWPNKCSDNKIYDYLEEITPKSQTILKQDGKMGILPLIVDGKPYGAIVAYNHFDKINQKEIEYLEEIKSQATATLTRAKSYIEVLEHATLDALTGYNNRHQFEKRLKEMTSSAKRQNQPLCCIMSDIDFFKKVNDTYGHAVGDCVLKSVAKTIKRELRESDIASRYGGEEFVFLLPQTNLEEATLVAQRLRASVEKKKINIEEYNIKDVKEISVTVSIGVSEYKNEKDYETLYKKADSALYEAKEGGRNRVIIA
ncbi:MAG: sensor domain-containing diguanylate cyclase [Candidatus Gastranaerophilales bacterium]|nr:sensor domain-containing diguanylate cyclase [Candidatus Gastranaerophilales bacterium]